MDVINGNLFATLVILWDIVFYFENLDRQLSGFGSTLFRLMDRTNINPKLNFYSQFKHKPGF